MLNRNVTRTVKNSTETTYYTQDFNANTVAFVLTTSDYFYVGHQDKFASRYFQLGTVNTNSLTLTVEYWDGSAWAAVDDVVDQTLGFTQNGFVGWMNKNNWQKQSLTPIDTDVELYWIRMSVSANMSAGSTLQSVTNQFTDTALLRAFYPELVTDTLFLPSGRTDFIEQFNAAKDLVVLRLKQQRTINTESQIIDINEVAIAATHAAAYIIYKAIARDDTMRLLADDAYKAFANELASVNLGVDTDSDGIQDDVERTQFQQTLVIRR